MMAKITVNGPDFEVCSGLRQGYVLASTLLKPFGGWTLERDTVSVEL